MSGPRGGFTLVLIRGGGTRMLRLSCSRGLLWAGALLGMLAGAAVATAYWDYFSLKRTEALSAARERRMEEQRALLDAFERRVAEISREVVAWQTLHARAWSAFGPAPGSTVRGTGVGGSTALLPLVFGGEEVALPQQLAQLQRSVAERGRSLRALERFVERSRDLLLALPVRWPVRGPLNSRFGLRPSPWTSEPEFHRGLDISASRGTPVLAPASGTVFFAGNGGEYGTTLILGHGHGLRSLYGHLQELRVKTGQPVERGQLVALTGNTGRSSGPHLHYEIHVRGQAVDPRQFLWE